MKSANRTARPEGFLAVARNYERGTIVALNHARGCYADDAAMPAFAVQHNAKGIAERRVAADALFERPQNAPLFFLAAGVELVEFAGQLAGTRRIFHAEKFDHIAGYIHAAGGIDAGRDTKPNFGGSGRAIRRNLRDFEQRFQSGIHRVAQCIQTEFGEDTIFAGERNRIGDGGDRRNFHKRQQQLVLIFVAVPGTEAALHQALREFEGHARAAELLVGILASRLVGIDYGQCLGHAVGTGEVMISDDEIHAQAVRRFRRREGADAHIDADDQANAGRSRAFDHIVAQIIAFPNAVRDVEIGRAAAEFDRRLQNDHGHGAVDVVVAVNQNLLFAFDSRVDAVDGGAKAGHEFRRVQMGQRRREKPRGGFCIGDAAHYQQAG